MAAGSPGIRPRCFRFLNHLGVRSVHWFQFVPKLVFNDLHLLEHFLIKGWLRVFNNDVAETTSPHNTKTEHRLNSNFWKVVHPFAGPELELSGEESMFDTNFSKWFWIKYSFEMIYRTVDETHVDSSRFGPTTVRTFCLYESKGCLGGPWRSQSRVNP